MASLPNRPPAPNETILLLGIPRLVAEFAAKLTALGRSFYILNRPYDEIEMLEQAQDTITTLMNSMLLGDEANPENADDDDDDDIHEYYIPYEHAVIQDLIDIPADIDVSAIIDINLVPASIRVSQLIPFTEEYPSAIIYASTLTCTATEINSMMPLPTQVVGWSSLPGFSNRSTIEIAPSLRTRDITRQRATEFFLGLGYEPEIIEDRVGLVTPRMLAMLVNEAAFAVMENVATPQDIDAAMKLGVNYPKGLLEWADEIGIEIIYAILEALSDEYRQERYRPCPLLRQYVHAGWVGKESGKGFYSYLPAN